MVVDALEKKAAANGCGRFDASPIVQISRNATARSCERLAMKLRPEKPASFGPPRRFSCAPSRPPEQVPGYVERIELSLSL